MYQNISLMGIRQDPYFFETEQIYIMRKSPPYYIYKYGGDLILKCFPEIGSDKFILSYFTC